MTGKFKYGCATTLVLLAILVCATLACLVVVPAASPQTGAFVADIVREVAGPEITADLENLSFWIRDQYKQFVSKWGGSELEIRLEVTEIPTATPTQPVPTEVIPPTQVPTATPTPMPSVVTADPQLGWQPYGPTIDGIPVMSRVIVTVDPGRPYAGIALVRIDLTKTELHIVPGFLEPSHSKEVTEALPLTGAIPSEDMPKVIAAFNGGFKAVNGQFGMVVGDVTLLPPIDGIATLVIYKDGSVRIGVWGKDLNYDPNIAAIRQNCPPIISDGQINPQVSVDDRRIWGRTVENGAITWRTGIGISRDGRFLIFAVGNAASVETLARALLLAGASDAMQLDINQHYAHFVTYEEGKAIPLINEMEDNPQIYLEPHTRDFFYLTGK